MEKKIASPAMKGVVISLVLIVISLVLQFANLDQHKGLASLGMFIFFGAIIYSGILYSQQNNGYVSFGNIFTDSFKTSAAVAAIMIVFTILSVKVLFPDSIEKGLQAAQAEMEKGNMSDEQVETSINLTRKFFVPFAIGGALLAYLLTGVIASLIGAAVAKKKPQDPFVNQG